MNTQNNSSYWNATSDLGFIIDATAVIKKVNRSTEKKLGYRGKELVGDSLFRYAQTNFHATIESILKQCKLGKVRSVVEIGLKNSSGEAVWIDASLTYDSKENTLYCMGRDVTNKMQAERKLFQSDSILQMAIDEVPCPIAIYEITEKPFHLRYLKVSKSYADFVGYSIDELIKKERSDVSLMLNNEDVEMLTDVAVTGKGVQALPVVLTTQFGYNKQILLTALKVEYSSGNYLYTSIVDVTDHYIAKTKVIEQNTELESLVGKLNHKNIALAEVVDSMAQEKTRCTNELCKVVKNQLEPVINRIRSYKSPDLGILESLNAIVSSLEGNGQGDLEEKLLKLSAKELEIALLIRKGYSSKEIATIFSIGFRTIESARKNIRKKLGLQYSSSNLKNYLSSLTV
ncbi:MAG: PAS domain S-box protein [Fibrobacterales bacterium]